jgi:chaperonin GroES
LGSGQGRSDFETAGVVKLRQGFQDRENAGLGRKMPFRDGHQLNMNAPFSGLRLRGGVNMKIKPMNDRVLVTRVEEEQKTAGGIIIPDTAKEKPQEGEVVAVGPGKRDEGGRRIPLEVKAGNRILFGKYAGTEIKIDGEEHIFMREDDILAVFD